MKKLSLDALRGKKGNIVSNNLLTMISGGCDDKEDKKPPRPTGIRKRPRSQVFE